MATCEATGPITMRCGGGSVPSGAIDGSSGVTSRWVPNVCTTPWLASTRPSRIASGRSSPNVQRTRSRQKLPTVPLSRRTSPRTSTASTHKPLAADTKFCTVRPSDWEIGASVVSPLYDCQLVLVVKLAAVLMAISQGTAGSWSGFQGSSGCNLSTARSRPKPTA